MIVLLSVFYFMKKFNEKLIHFENIFYINKLYIKYNIFLTFFIYINFK